MACCCSHSERVSLSHPNLPMQSWTVWMGRSNHFQTCLIFCCCSYSVRGFSKTIYYTGFTRQAAKYMGHDCTFCYGNCLIPNCLCKSNKSNHLPNLPTPLLSSSSFHLYVCMCTQNKNISQKPFFFFSIDPIVVHSRQCSLMLLSLMCKLSVLPHPKLCALFWCTMAFSSSIAQQMWDVLQHVIM